jgi:hypothetical protein
VLSTGGKAGIDTSPSLFPYHSTGRISITFDVGHLPTKDEFYEKLDQVMGELKAVREEFSVLGHQVSDHDRLEKLESEQDTSSN